MTLTADPEIQEKIDLTWVTFAEEDPTVPCRFQDCDQDASHMLTALPCAHEYPFCQEHVMYTKGVMALYRHLMCTDCKGIIDTIKYDPIKRG